MTVQAMKTVTIQITSGGGIKPAEYPGGQNSPLLTHSGHSPLSNSPRPLTKPLLEPNTNNRESVLTDISTGVAESVASTNFPMLQQPPPPQKKTPRSQSSKYQKSPLRPTKSTLKNGLTIHHLVIFVSLLACVIAITTSCIVSFTRSLHMQQQRLSTANTGAPANNDTKQMQMQVMLDEFLAKTDNIISEKLAGADDKLALGLRHVKSEMERMLNAHKVAIGNHLSDTNEQIQELEESLKRFADKGFVSAREVTDIANSIVNERQREREGGYIGLAEVRSAIAQMIESDIQRHSADGIGRVDYALASGGGRVLEHSHVYNPESQASSSSSSWTNNAKELFFSSTKHPWADEILRPKFGEPGRCLPLKGSNVYVIVGLRTSIHIEAITLEHISKNVAYDISSAPRQFKVYGVYSEDETEEDNWILLGEFAYNASADKSIQTFSFTALNTGFNKIDKIKVHVLSNHGSPTHTCIYRIRVHGQE